MTQEEIKDKIKELEDKKLRLLRTPGYSSSGLMYYEVEYIDEELEKLRSGLTE